MASSRITLALLTAFTVCAQQTTGPLTNPRIGDMVLAGVSQTEIIRIISTAPQISFDLRPGSTDNLLKVGVSEAIIKAMAAREAGIGPPQSAFAATFEPAQAMPQPKAITAAPQKDSDPRTRIFVAESAVWEASSFNVAHASSSFVGAFGSSRVGLTKLTIAVMN